MLSQKKKFKHAHFAYTIHKVFKDIDLRKNGGLEQPYIVVDMKTGTTSLGNKFFKKMQQIPTLVSLTCSKKRPKVLLFRQLQTTKKKYKILLFRQ